MGRARAVWLIARLGSRIDECARSVRAALALAESCSVLLIAESTYTVIHLTASDISDALTESDFLACIEDARGRASCTHDNIQGAVDELVSADWELVPSSNGTAPLLVLDEQADED